MTGAVRRRWQRFRTRVVHETEMISLVGKVPGGARQMCLFFLSVLYAMDKQKELAGLWLAAFFIVWVVRSIEKDRRRREVDVRERLK